MREKTHIAARQKSLQAKKSKAKEQQGKRP